MIFELAKITHISALEILGRSKSPQVINARILYYKLLREKGYSLTEIGRLCDRTHATVLSGIRRANALLETSDEAITALWRQVQHIER